MLLQSADYVVKREFCLLTGTRLKIVIKIWDFRKGIMYLIIREERWYWKTHFVWEEIVDRELILGSRYQDAIDTWRKSRRQ